MTYQWKAGSHIAADAQAAGEQCSMLTRSGGLTPSRLVDLNRPVDAPLHNEFEWDDSIAAEAYRETQARHIIQCITVRLEEHPKVPTRAFVRASVSVGVYEPIRTVMADPEKSNFLVESARRESEAFLRKYQGLAEVKEIINAIKSTFGEAAAQGGRKDVEQSFSSGTACS